MTTQQRWAVILGASSGTGAGIAQALAVDPGLNIFGVHRGRYAEQAAEVEQAVRATGRTIVMWVADAATLEGAQQGVQQLLQIAGKGSIYMLVHSIASASMGQFVVGESVLHPRQLEKTFDAMAHSFVHWTRELYNAELLAPGARLLGLNNPLSHTHLYNTGAVSASKAALEQYIQHLAIELGPEGYRVNMLTFGTVMTSALRHVYAPDVLKRLEEAHCRMNPAGRMSTVEEVARFVSVLARDEAAWFNGATIDFSGGMNLKLIDMVLNADRYDEGGDEEGPSGGMVKERQ
ncbi:MAG: SDR family oxidoreductase [Myxococcota bacterium]